jgi:hypothetical protein
MDYRELLLKYIMHVQASEGTDFIDRYRDGLMSSHLVDFFTNEESKELRILAAVVDEAERVAQTGVVDMPPGKDRAGTYAWFLTKAIEGSREKVYVTLDGEQ